MDYFKVKSKHVLSSDLSDAEVGQLVRFQAKISFFERPLSEKEKSETFSPKKMEKIISFLQDSDQISLEKVAEKILEDVEKSLKNSKKSLEKVRAHRERLASKMAENADLVTGYKSVTGNPDVTRIDKIRGDEIREEKSIKKENILTDISKKKPSESSISDTVSLWNAFAFQNGLTQVRDLTQKRITGVKARLSEKNFQLEAVFREISCSEFLLGGNKDGWKVTFDFVFLSANNWLKIVEGNYRNNGKKTKTMEEIFNELK